MPNGAGSEPSRMRATTQKYVWCPDLASRRRPKRPSKANRAHAESLDMGPRLVQFSCANCNIESRHNLTDSLYAASAPAAILYPPGSAAGAIRYSPISSSNRMPVAPKPSTPMARLVTLCRFTPADARSMLHTCHPASVKLLASPS